MRSEYHYCTPNLHWKPIEVCRQHKYPHCKKCWHHPDREGPKLLVRRNKEITVSKKEWEDDFGKTTETVSIVKEETPKLIIRRKPNEGL